MYKVFVLAIIMVGTFTFLLAGKNVGCGSWTGEYKMERRGHLFTLVLRQSGEGTFTIDNSQNHVLWELDEESGNVLLNGDEKTFHQFRELIGDPSRRSGPRVSGVRAYYGLGAVCYFGVWQRLYVSEDDNIYFSYENK